MKIRLGVFKQSERGASAVELALLLPILAMVFVGIAEYSFAFYDTCSLDGAARAALAYAVKNQNDTTGIQTVAQQAAGALTSNATVASSQYCECAGGSAVSCTGSCSPQTMKKYMQVTVSISYSSPINSILLIAPPSTLSSTAVMRVQ